MIQGYDKYMSYLDDKLNHLKKLKKNMEFEKNQDTFDDGIDENFLNEDFVITAKNTRGGRVIFKYNSPDGEEKPVFVERDVVNSLNPSNGDKFLVDDFRDSGSGYLFAVGNVRPYGEDSTTERGISLNRNYTGLPTHFVKALDDNPNVALLLQTGVELDDEVYTLDYSDYFLPDLTGKGTGDILKKGYLLVYVDNSTLYIVKHSDGLRFGYRIQVDRDSNYDYSLNIDDTWNESPGIAYHTRRNPSGVWPFARTLMHKGGIFVKANQIQ